jgi:hypothetical protein
MTRPSYIVRSQVTPENAEHSFIALPYTNTRVSKLLHTCARACVAAGGTGAEGRRRRRTVHRDSGRNGGERCGGGRRASALRRSSAGGGDAGGTGAHHCPHTQVFTGTESWGIADKSAMFSFLDGSSWLLQIQVHLHFYTAALAATLRAGHAHIVVLTQR